MLTNSDDRAGADFSSFDETGMPTHDKDGNVLPKSAIKKLAKEGDVCFFELERFQKEVQ